MKKTAGLYPSLTVDGHGGGVLPNSGAVLLLRTAETVGLVSALGRGAAAVAAAVGPASPGKVLLDLAVSLAENGRLPASASHSARRPPREEAY